jgi:hypothetical protein
MVAAQASQNPSWQAYAAVFLAAETQEFFHARLQDSSHSADPSDSEPATGAKKSNMPDAVSAASNICLSIAGLEGTLMTLDLPVQTRVRDVKDAIISKVRLPRW